MLGFVIGLAAGFLWFILWTLMLRAAGIPVFGKSPEQREMYRQRFLRMGQARYVVVERILRHGVAFGLALAVSGFIRHPSDGWIYAVWSTVVYAVISGLVYSVDGWARVRGPVPFPPESLREK